MGNAKYIYIYNWIGTYFGYFKIKSTTTYSILVFDELAFAYKKREIQIDINKGKQDIESLVKHI